MSSKCIIIIIFFSPNVKLTLRIFFFPFPSSSFPSSYTYLYYIHSDGTLSVKDTSGMPSLKQMKHVGSSSILRRINLAEFSTSTKIEKLVEELFAMRKERAGSKALVFSQFTSMLDLVRWRLISDPCLQDLGLGVRIIHGGMNVKSREEALKVCANITNIQHNELNYRSTEYIKIYFYLSAFFPLPLFNINCIALFFILKVV